MFLNSQCREGMGLQGERFNISQERKHLKRGKMSPTVCTAKTLGAKKGLEFEQESTIFHSVD